MNVFTTFSLLSEDSETECKLFILYFFLFTLGQSELFQ